MATGFDTLGCPFCNAPCRPVEYKAHVDSCMRIAVSDGRDHEMGGYPQLADQLKPYGGGDGSAGSDRGTDPPDGGSDGGWTWRRRS